MAESATVDHRLKLAKNTFYSAITTSAGLLLFVLMILSGRHLGSNDFGIFSFALALASIFAITTDFGLDDLIVREVTRDRRRAQEYFGNVIVWKAILSIFALLALFVTVNILKSSTTIRMVAYLLGLMAIFRSFITTIRAFFRAFERFDLESRLVVLDRVSLFGFAVLFLLLGRDVIVLACAFVCVRFCTLIFALALLHRKVTRVVPRFNFQFIKAFQLQAMPFGLAFLCFGLYTYFDKIVISLMRSEAEVGLYNAGFQIYEGLMIVPVILGAVLYPRLSQLFVSDRGRLGDLLSRGMKYMIVIALPVAAWGLLFSEDIVAKLFGQEYLETALSLSILLCGMVISFQNVLLHTFLNSIDRQKYMLITTLAGLFVAICLDLILIPRYGIVGAAIATIGYALTIFSASYGYIFLRHSRISMLRIMWKPLLCVLLISAFLWRLGPSSTVLSLVIFIPMYVLLLLLLKVFDRVELELFHRLAWQRLVGRR